MISLVRQRPFLNLWVFSFPLFCSFDISMLFPGFLGPIFLFVSFSHFCAGDDVTFLRSSRWLFHCFGRYFLLFGDVVMIHLDASHSAEEAGRVVRPGSLFPWSISPGNIDIYLKTKLYLFHGLPVGLLPELKLSGHTVQSIKHLLLRTPFIVT